jgi:hypothetical protein
MINLEQSCKSFHEVRRIPVQNFWKTYFEYLDRQDILNDSRFSEYFSWKPNRSNCPDIEVLFQGLIDSTPEPWRTRGKRIFAGRNFHGDANAEAWRSGEVGVIEINFGITSAAMIYGVLYSKYFEMIQTLATEVDFDDDDHETLMMILEEVGLEGFSPILIADREKSSWLSQRNVFPAHRLLKELPTSRDQNSYHELVRSIEEFILAHELAHHLLGHPDDPYPRSAENNKYLERVMRKHGISPPKGDLNAGQREELQADTLALLMMTGALTDEATPARIYRATAGSIIGLTAMAHINDTWVTPSGSDETHPDFITRYETATGIINQVSEDIPRGPEGGHPKGFISQLSGFVSLILDRWLSKTLKDHQPANILNLAAWLFERAREMEGEIPAASKNSGSSTT